MARVGAAARADERTRLFGEGGPRGEECLDGAGAGDAEAWHGLPPLPTTRDAQGQIGERTDVASVQHTHGPRGEPLRDVVDDLRFGWACRAQRLDSRRSKEMCRFAQVRTNIVTLPSALFNPIRKVLILWEFPCQSCSRSRSPRRTLLRCVPCEVHHGLSDPQQRIMLEATLSIETSCERPGCNHRRTAKPGRLWVRYVGHDELVMHSDSTYENNAVTKAGGTRDIQGLCIRYVRVPELIASRVWTNGWRACCCASLLTADLLHALCKSRLLSVS
ncbi:hypothetical protein QFZ98_004819 [Paraburkholderia youngii]